MNNSKNIVKKKAPVISIFYHDVMSNYKLIKYGIIDMTVYRTILTTLSPLQVRRLIREFMEITKNELEAIYHD